MKFLSYVIVLFLTLSIVTTGCSSKKEAENNQETQIAETEKENYLVEETETFEEDNEDDTGSIVVANRNAQWPKDIPSFFPKLKGKIVGVIEDTEDGYVKYSVMYGKITTNDMDEFTKEIEAKPGWTITTTHQTEVRWIVIATNDEKDAQLQVIATIGEGEEDSLSGGMDIKFKR
ncbi:MAG: hypothetical protein KAH01_05590 [Caldisericia bacterium]|nr:hypothetical protein [Caldisericia bacterium]